MSRASHPTERLARARERVGRLESHVGAAEARSVAVTPGGLTGYDPAILSGIRRKPDHKGNARRFATYDREAALWRDLDRARRDVATLERRAEVEAVEATLHSQLTVDAIRAARYVRTRHGWHKVVRVSAKSVTVETGYSWTDRIALTDVLEARP